jgi:hypothetical protein
MPYTFSHTGTLVGRTAPMLSLCSCRFCISRCASTPIVYISSCLFCYFCDSDIVSLFKNQEEWVCGYPPTVSTYLLWWPELQDGEPDSFVTFGRCSLASSAKVYPPLGVSSSIPVQGGGSVRSLFCFLSVISCERKLWGLSGKKFLYRRFLWEMIA